MSAGHNTCLDGGGRENLGLPLHARPGAAGPGPSSEGTGERPAPTIASIAVAVLLALTASAAVATHGFADRIASPAALAAVTAAATGISALVVFGLANGAQLRRLPLPVWLLSAGAGIATAAVPYIISANRFSDAPAGSLVVFVTTSLWGLVAVLAAAGLDAFVRRGSPSLLPIAGALLAVVSGAGILANWERPSSFSPIVRFGAQQGVMLLAGILWVAALVATAWLARRHGKAAVVSAFAAGALLAAVALLPFTGLATAEIDLVLPYSLSAGVTTTLALWLFVRGRARIAGPSMMAAPALLSLLTIVEQYVGVLGPRPLLVGPVLTASGLLALGIAAAVVNGREGPAVAGAGGRLRVVAIGLAAGAGVASVAALLLPALRVTVHGVLPTNESFDAVFSMAGFEAVGPWLALAATVLLGAAIASPRVSSAIVRTVAALAAAGGALTPLGGTPTHTWVTWLPPDVQQDYGTEYASIVFERLPAPALYVVFVLTALTALVLARALLLTRMDDTSADGSGTEARE